MRLDTLLYIGKATEKTFSAPLWQHQHWLRNEDPVQVYLERVCMPERYVRFDNWPLWAADIQLAERVLIYKYSLPYNSVSIAEPPNLGKFDKIVLIKNGPSHRLHKRDTAPDDRK